MPKTSTAKPFARYARVSRVGGRTGQGYISVPEQTRTMDALAKAQGVEVVPELFKDEDRSGGNLDRPEFQRILTLLREGEIGGVVVAKLDRFSRDVVDFLATLREIEDLGGRLLCGDGAVSLRNGSDAFTATIRMAAAALERDQRGEYLDASVRNAIERGVHLHAPFGYRKSDGKGSKLEPDPIEAPAVRKAFELRAAGFTWSAIAAALNEAGVLPRPRKRHGVRKQARWTHKGVRQIVLGEVYLGTAFNGGRRHPGAHEPLVTPDLYAAANRTKGTKALAPSEGYLLSGLVRCSGCGYVARHASLRGRRYYRCEPGQHGDGPCPAPLNVPAEALEQYVVAEFKARYLAGGTATPALTDEHIQAAEVKVAAAEAQLAGSMAMMRRLGEMTATEQKLAERQVDEDRAALRDAEAERATAKMRARSADLPPELTEELFDKSPLPEQRHWISKVFRCVVVRRAIGWREPAADRARILLVDDAPADSTRLIPFARELDLPARPRV
jgi:site-specific DNA recombinase